jgi:hypothetical protein
MENVKVSEDQNKYSSIVEFKTDEDIIDIILNNTAEQVCEVSTRKLEKLNKKSRLVKEDTADAVFGKPVYCTATRNVIICAEYSELRKRSGEIVESEAAPDGINVRHELPWGEWVQGSNNQIISHKESFYLRTYLADKISTKEYTYEDGSKLEQDKINRLSEFQPPVSSSDKEDVKVIVNNITIGSILSITINYTKYIRKV